MQTGSLINNVMSRSTNAHGQVVPEVGMGVTELGWTDRHPYTIVKVLSPTRIQVQADTATRVDENGMSDSQKYTFEPNPEGAILTLKLLKGGWMERAGGNTFAIGFRSRYYDFSF